jgi:hypothetical protein
MSNDERFEREQAEEAAEEAARIGGRAGDEDLEPAERAVSEGGGGVSEGFELAEQELIEHASHGDQQSAHAILHNQGRDEELGMGEDGEDDAGDHELSSERDSD